jgi:hypothetical protein
MTREEKIERTITLITDQIIPEILDRINFSDESMEVDMEPRTGYSRIKSPKQSIGLITEAYREVIDQLVEEAEEKVQRLTVEKKLIGDYIDLIRSRKLFNELTELDKLSLKIYEKKQEKVNEQLALSLEELDIILSATSEIRVLFDKIYRAVL